MKIEKGNAGYISGRKKTLGLQTAAVFALAVIVFVVGLVLMSGVLNLLTIAALLVCVPGVRLLRQFLEVFPYHTIEENEYQEIEEKGYLLTTAYDLVLKTKKHTMPLSAVVISNHTVFGYAPDKKADPELTAAYLKKMLTKTRMQPSTVKVFSEYVPFLSRVEGLNNMIEVSQSADKRVEGKIRKRIMYVSI